MLTRRRLSFWIAILAAVTAAAACGGGDDDGADPDAGRPITFGGDRPVQLQVPPTVVEGQRYPLLVILHGYGAGGFVQQVYLQLGDLPATDGVFVLAPDGTVDPSGNQFWNADPVCCDFNNSGVDDVAYIGGLIDQVSAAWPIDPARVWLAGHSNGAFMAYRMACDRADVVTAIAGLAGAAASTPSSCNPTRPVHVLHLHGTADGTVPYPGGSLGGPLVAPGAEASVDMWAGFNGCTGARTAAGRKDLEASIQGDDTAVEVTSGCPADGAADLWAIEGGGHIPSWTTTFGTELTGWLAAHPR